MHAFVKNWQIDKNMTTDLNHEVIQFTISVNEAEMIKSSLNSSYNTNKADWTSFAKQLCQKSENILNLVKNSENTQKDLENIVILFRNLILDTANQHISKRKPFIKAKIWWHDDLNSLRKSMNLAKRLWKQNKNESSWKEVIFFKNKYFHAIQKVKEVSQTNFLQGAAEKDVFTAYHFIKSRKIAKISFIQYENSLKIIFEKKFKMFLKAMFSESSEFTATPLKSDDLDTITWKLITFEEVEQTIKSLSLKKASKSDELSFLILQQTFQTISELFFAILQNY